MTFLLVEQKHLDIAKTEQDKCYNLKFEAMGGQWSEYSRDKMRGKNNPMFGKTHTDEVKKFLSQLSQGRKLTNEHKQKVSKARQGMKFSKETKRRISESKKGVNNPNFGKPMSEDHKRKIGDANRGRKVSEEMKKKMSERMKGNTIAKKERMEVLIPSVPAQYDYRLTPKINLECQSHCLP